MKNSTKPKLNVRLLRRIQKHILEEPRRLFMWDWRVETPIKRSQRLQPPCGTAACIAGWAMILSKKRFGWSAADGATKVLGLNGSFNDDDSEPTRLFDPDSWPEKFRDKYDLNVEKPYASELPTMATLKKNARVAVARIEHFIKTRE